MLKKITISMGRLRIKHYFFLSVFVIVLVNKDIKYQQLGGNEIFLHNEDQKLNLSKQL